MPALPALPPLLAAVPPVAVRLAKDVDTQSPPMAPAVAPASPLEPQRPKSLLHAEVLFAAPLPPAPPLPPRVPMPAPAPVGLLASAPVQVMVTLLGT